MKRVVVVAAVLAAFVLPTACWGQDSGVPGAPAGFPRPAVPGGFAGGMGVGASCPASALNVPSAQMWDRMADTLGLTDDQYSQLRELATKNAETMRPLYQKAAEATQALREALSAPEFTTSTVEALAAAAEKAEAAIIAAQIKQWAQVRQIITAEQASKLATGMGRSRVRPNDRIPGAPGPGGVPGAPRNRRGGADAPPPPMAPTPPQ